MTLRVVGRHLDIGTGFRQRITDQVSALVSKYFDGGFSGHMTLAREGTQHKSELMIHLDTGVLLRVSARCETSGKSVDMLVDRLEKRLRRYKRRLRDYSARADGGPAQAVPRPDGQERGQNHIEGHGLAGHSALTGHSFVIESPGGGADGTFADGHAPAIIAETAMRVGTQSVGGAVLTLDASGEAFHIFKNAGNGRINVVYRRRDGNVGWIDPGENPASARSGEPHQPGTGNTGSESL